MVAVAVSGSLPISDLAVTRIQRRSDRYFSCNRVPIGRVRRASAPGSYGATPLPDDDRASLDSLRCTVPSNVIGVAAFYCPGSARTFSRLAAAKKIRV